MMKFTIFCDILEDLVQLFAAALGAKSFLMHNAMELNDLMFYFFNKQLHETRRCPYH